MLPTRRLITLNSHSLFAPKTKRRLHISRILSEAETYAAGRVAPVRRPQKESTIVTAAVHGVTTEAGDLQVLLDARGKDHVKHLEYVIRKNRREGVTFVTMRYKDSDQARLAQSTLREEFMNGARINCVQTADRMPLRYDPLHVSSESGPGRVVSIEGLPFGTREAHLSRALGGYDLVDNAELRFHQVKTPSRDSSAWLVRLKTEDEAQRLVRTINSTYYLPKDFGYEYFIKAEVFF